MSVDPALVHRFTQEVTPAARHLLDVLQALEPAFIEAGRLARDLQGKVDVEKKADSGNERTDVVTEADRLVQERLLGAMAGTDLAGCRLLAEETPQRGHADLRGRFAVEADLYLTVDPIDGTSRYTRNLPYFSTIIGLHDGRRPLYTFMHYPAFGWWVRIVDRVLTMSGPPPIDLAHLALDKTIVYTAGDPDRDAPQVAADLRARGADIRFGESIGAWGSKYLYLSGQAGGYFGGNPNLYDGLFALHCAMARGNTVLAQGRRPGTPLDLTDMEEGAYGMHHPGWYVVVPVGL